MVLTFLIFPKIKLMKAEDIFWGVGRSSPLPLSSPLSRSQGSAPLSHGPSFASSVTRLLHLDEFIRLAWCIALPSDVGQGRRNDLNEVRPIRAALTRDDAILSARFKINSSVKQHYLEKRQKLIKT